MQTDILQIMRRLNRSIKRHFESSPVKQELENLTGTHGWVIVFLSEHENEDIYQKDLEKQFGISRSTTSKMLAQMEKKGLVGRERVACDDRLKKIVLTERSRELAFKARQDSVNAEKKLTKGFSDAELKTLKNYIDRMIENMQN